MNDQLTIETSAGPMTPSKAMTRADTLLEQVRRLADKTPDENDARSHNERQAAFEMWQCISGWTSKLTFFKSQLPRRLDNLKRATEAAATWRQAAATVRGIAAELEAEVAERGPNAQRAGRSPGYTVGRELAAARGLLADLDAVVCQVQQVDRRTRVGCGFTWSLTEHEDATACPECGEEAAVLWPALPLGFGRSLDAEYERDLPQSCRDVFQIVGNLPPRIVCLDRAAGALESLRDLIEQKIIGTEAEIRRGGDRWGQMAPSSP
ncbi:MAG TPA: hypothetical protein VHQ65_07750 [Thermoanaerobaculia bacterium]|nr:hypothetical protein [Thermoanaerobaculia bacterium]